MKNSYNTKERIKDIFLLMYYGTLFLVYELWVTIWEIIVSKIRGKEK